MVVNANVAAAHPIWSMITLRHFLVGEVVNHPIFNSFVCHAIGVNPIVVLVKFMTGMSVPIAAIKNQQISRQVLQANAPD